MRRRTLVPVALALAAAAAATPLATALTGGSAARKPKFASLTGAAEKPGPGDADGRGSATILFPSDGKICFAILVTGIGKPTAAHIHKGGPGVAGPVVVGLTPPKSGSAGAVSGCLAYPKATLAPIAANPAGFYVNVHTTDRPDGAIRGQLFAK